MMPLLSVVEETARGLQRRSCQNGPVIARFGSYEIDFDTIEIRRAGRTVPVQPQVFSVIEFLVGERHRVVSKEEVLDTVWGDRFVSESALTSRIKSARRALGDSGAEQAVIRTVVGRGYRFVAELADDAAPDPGAGSTHEDVDASPTASGRDARVSAVASSNTDQTPHPGAANHGDWPLIGRSRELEKVDELIADRSVPGVMITGPPDIGATRFADECRDRAEARGQAVARVVGLRSGASIPLAAISHLLPDDVLHADQASDELARTEILRRAQRTLEELAGEGRLLITIENPSFLDPLSATVISSLLLSGAAFGIEIRASATEAGEPLEVDALLQELPLPGLDETAVDILLHRVLGGPLEPATLRQILAISSGRPGLIRDVVETSLAAGTLVRDHGVWRLDGELASTEQLSWDPSTLSDEAVSGAEKLALVTSLSEQAATTVLGDVALDELDRAHLLALSADHRVSLANPLLVNTVRNGISPLRERRLKEDLTESLVADGDPATLATIARWHGEGAGRIDDAVLRTAAQVAMIEGEMATAGVLVEHIVKHDDPSVQLIEAEVALRRSQWERAENLFENIAVDDLDEISTSHVLRRRAAIQFYSKARFDETIDWVTSEAAKRPGRAARALLARRVGMLAFLGRTTATLDAADALGEVSGLLAIEVMLSTGSANFHRGHFTTTLETMDGVDELIDQLPEAWAAEPRDGVVTVRCSALLHNGRIAEAVDLSRKSLPIGKRTELGFFPSLAAMIELAAGRPRAAREMVRQAIQSSHREAFPQYLRLAEALFAVTDLAIGNNDAAAAGLERARASMPVVSGELHWLLAMNIARLAAGLGRSDPPEVLFELADDANATGASMREADLLTTAALLDPSGEVAGQVVERVEALVTGLDGDYWPIRAQHLRAVVDGRDLAPIMDAYQAYGYDGRTF